MKTIYLTTIAMLTIFAVPALADTFPGAAATGCDVDRFTPIYSGDGETVLYWNNPTCPDKSGTISWVPPVEDAVESEEGGEVEEAVKS